MAAPGLVQRPAPVLDSPLPVVAGGLLAAGAVGLALAAELQVGIAVLIGVIYMPLAFINLPLAVAAWVPLLYLEAIPAVSAGPLAATALVAAAWLGTIASGGSRAGEVVRRHAAVVGTLVVLLAWMALSIAWASDTAAALVRLQQWILAAIVLTIVATTISTRRELFAVCGAFVAGALLSVAVGLPQISSAATVQDQASRLGGSFTDSNYLAAGLVAALFVAAGMVTAARRPGRRRALVVAIGVLAVGIAATGSRGGLVAAGVALVAALLVMRGDRLRIGAATALAVAVGALWLATISPSTLDRVRNFDTGGAGRVDIWQVAGRMSGDHPIAGVGLNGFRSESAGYVGEPGQLEDVDLIVERPHVVHNAYLQQLAETGIVGLVLLLGVLVALVRVTWVAARRFQHRQALGMAALARGILVAQVAAVSALMFISNAWDQRLWVLLALGPILLTIAEREELDA